MKGEIQKVYEEICNDIDTVKFFYSENYLRTNGIDIKTSLNIIANCIALDLIHRKEESSFQYDFFTKFNFSLKDRYIIYRLSLTEMFKIYYFAEKSVKKSENIKIFLNSKANFFRIEKNLFFFNDRKKVSKILYNLITDYCYEINSFEKISLSLSLYFHSHNNLLNKICPINFIGKYEQFFLLKKMDIEVFKSFSDYLRNLYYALTDKKDENSFIYCLTSTVFEVLKTKYFTKYKNTKNFNQDRLRNFFNLEQFILYLNFLYNYDNGVFNMIRDKTMKKFFYENVFEIIYYFCNENFQMAILVE